MRDGIKKLIYSSYINKNIKSQKKEVLLSSQPITTRSLLKHCFNFPVAQFNIHKCNEALKTVIKVVKKALEHTTRGMVERNWGVHPGEEKFTGYTRVIFKCVKGWKRKWICSE